MSLNPDLSWTPNPLEQDVRYGFLNRQLTSLGGFRPEVVMNAGDGATVLRTILSELRRCDEFLFSVAFVSAPAVAMLKQDLFDFKGKGLIVTGTYNTFNKPEVFHELNHLQVLQDDLEMHVHNSTAFHPKGYIFRHGDSVTAIIGSSNLTVTALTRNHEWNLKVSAASDSDLAAQLDRLCAQQRESSSTITSSWIDSYARTYASRSFSSKQGLAHTESPLPVPDTLAESGLTGSEEVTPNFMQHEALQAIKGLREQGKVKAVVISATGTGKTILSALDVNAYTPRRFLYLVHREQIIDRAMAEYQQVLRGSVADFGKVVGSTKEFGAKYVFATIQTFARPEVLASIPPDSFDYVLMDEVHRAGAETYQRVLEHLKPRFLLGVTATPERSDGFNIFELFDYNVAYEIRLNDALTAEMLSPFHYFGVSDVPLPRGKTIDDKADIGELTGESRINHIVETLDRYSQQGVKTRGLIFCSRKEEARRLSAGLNQCSLGGRPIRTRALTGDDTSEDRTSAVKQLEDGELEYLLTVDIFNEGVDIPSINQIVMLRQTQSAIIFVQQLGRGLRKSPGKDFLTVIDFIGNYTNNYMIPIALFGDKSLNKESIRKNLHAAEVDGVLAGFSSVRFDDIARQRVLASIATARLDSLRELKREIELIERRLGRTPRLRDFWEQKSVDPMVLATKLEHFPALAYKTIGAQTGLGSSESRMLQLLSHEVLAAKRLHEFVLLTDVLSKGFIRLSGFRQLLEDSGLCVDDQTLKSVVDTFVLRGYSAGDRKKYQFPLLEEDGEYLRLTQGFDQAYGRNSYFQRAVDDIVWTGQRRTQAEYRHNRVFTPGSQYTRRDASRLLGWDRTNESTLMGYRLNWQTMQCPIFVTLDKGDDVEAHMAYQDQLLDQHTMIWDTRSGRTLESRIEKAIASNEADLHVFVKKDQKERAFYYLGQAHAQDAWDATLRGVEGKVHNVVRMLLRFEEPIEHTLYDYFHPAMGI
jgi:superfamily II DNA or RNA helicase